MGIGELSHQWQTSHPTDCVFTPLTHWPSPKSEVDPVASFTILCTSKNVSMFAWDCAGTSEMFLVGALDVMASETQAGAWEAFQQGGSLTFTSILNKNFLLVCLGVVCSA